MVVEKRIGLPCSHNAGTVATLQSDLLPERRTTPASDESRERRLQRTPGLTVWLIGMGTIRARYGPSPRARGRLQRKIVRAFGVAPSQSLGSDHLKHGSKLSNLPPSVDHRCSLESHFLRSV